MLVFPSTCRLEVLRYVANLSLWTWPVGRGSSTSCRRGRVACDTIAVRYYADIPKNIFVVEIVDRCSRCSSWKRSCSRAPRGSSQAGKFLVSLRRLQLSDSVWTMLIDMIVVGSVEAGHNDTSQEFKMKTLLG